MTQQPPIAEGLQQVMGAPLRDGLSSPTEPEVSALRASIPSAKRNWRGRFVKNLRWTSPESREWLIWSRYHNAWHCRSGTGGACGYTSDISRAGLFIRATADAYNDGDRNEAFHFSEKQPLIEDAIRQHNEATDRLLFLASAIEAGTAATVKQGAVHESAVGNAETPEGYLP